MGDFNIGLYLDSPLSCPYTYRKVKRVVVTQVCTWFSHRHVLLLIAMRERGGLDLSLYLASYVMSFYLWQGEKGVVLTYVFPLIAK